MKNKNSFLILIYYFKYNNECNILNLTKNELAFLFCFNNSIYFLNKLNTIENIKNNVVKFIIENVNTNEITLFNNKTDAA